MRTIDFNVPMLDLNGKEVKEQTLAQALSSYIGQQTKGQTLKLFGWHKTLQVGDPLHLDDADLEVLKKLITDNEDMYVFVKGQLLDVVNSKQ